MCLRPNILALLVLLTIPGTLYAAFDCTNYKNFADSDAPELYLPAPPFVVELVKDNIGIEYFLGPNLYVASELGLRYKDDDYYRKIKPLDIRGTFGGDRYNCSGPIELSGLWWYDISKNVATDRLEIQRMVIGMVLDDRYHSIDVLSKVGEEIAGLTDTGCGVLKGRYRLGDRFFSLSVRLYGAVDVPCAFSINRERACGEEYRKLFPKTIIEYEFWNETEDVRWYADCRETELAARRKARKIKID